MGEQHDHPGVGQIIRLQRKKLGFELEDLAEVTGIEKARIQSFEGGVSEEPTFEELGQLSRFLGVDLETYDPEDGELEKLPQIVTLLKSNENYLPNRDWATVITAAEIAQELVRLEEWLELPDRFRHLRDRFAQSSLSPNIAPWKQGQFLTDVVRKALDHEGPIESLYEFCRKLGVLIIEAYLPVSVSALCLSDPDHGPTIILNIQGTNDSLLPRRFAIAHELCHILFDEYGMESLQRFDTAPGFFEAKNKPDIEKRADAFAIYLLCPEGPFRAEWLRAEEQGKSPEEAVRHLMEVFGASFTATKSHLQSLNLLSHKQAESLSIVDTNTPEKFIEAEKQANPTAYDPLFAPLARMRRGEFLAAVLRGYERGLVSRSAVLELLDIDGTTFEKHRESWSEFLV